MSSSPPADDDEQPIVLRDESTGLEAHIVRAGAALQRLLVPVKNDERDAGADADADAAATADGAPAAAASKRLRRDVVLGYASPADYLTVDPTCYLGAVVGRLANRVAGARFAVGGREYALPANDGANSLHGGARGLDRRRWELVAASADAAPSVAPGAAQPPPRAASARLRYASSAGEEGYPGALEVEAVYSLPAGRVALRLEMRARCVSPSSGGGGGGGETGDEAFALPAEGTPVALAAHSYFNLAGSDTAPSVLAVRPGTVEDEGEDGAAAAAAAAAATSAAAPPAAGAAPAPPHFLHMPRALFFTPLDGRQIPTGSVEPVAGTPFDFASGPRALGERAARVPGADRPGYDHNFSLAGRGGGERAGAAAGEATAAAATGGAATAAATATTAPGGLLPLPEEGTGAPLPLAASLECSGLRMEVRTNAPGVQLYTGNYLGGEDGRGDGAAPAPKDGAAPYRRWAGVCLETQNWPDAVNRPGAFPSPLLKAGEEYVHVVEYCFSDV